MDVHFKFNDSSGELICCHCIDPKGNYALQICPMPNNTSRFQTWEFRGTPTKNITAYNECYPLECLTGPCTTDLTLSQLKDILPGWAQDRGVIQVLGEMPITA